MRKAVLTGIVYGLLFLQPAMAQHMPIDPETNMITYLEFVQLDTNITSSSIQGACLSWISSYYKSDDQLQSNSKMKGQIVKSANFPVFRRMYGRGGIDVEGGFVQYSITFRVQSKGRLIIAVSNFRHTDPATGRNFGRPEEFYAMSSKDFAVMKYYMDQIDTFSKELIGSAKSYVEGAAR